MSKKLIIVESPTKSHTIQKFLNEDTFVLACYGHLKALPKKSPGIQTRHNFAMSYRFLPSKKQVI